MKSDLQVGLIGAGGIARKRHVDGWLSLADQGVRVLAVADIDRSRAEGVAQLVGAPHVFTDYRELLALPEIDAVDIVTPAYIHKEQSVAALDAGKHVLCEKPLCVTPQEGEEIIAAWRHSGRKLMVAQHYRFPLAAQTARRIIAKGALGQVYHVRCHALRRRMLPGAPTFIYKRFSGGGPMLDIGVHILDLALFFMGFPKVVSVVGNTVTKLAKLPEMFSEWGDWDKQGFDVEDFACAFVRFENGATLILETSWLLNTDLREDFSLRMFGTQAGLAFPEMVLYGQSNGATTDTKLGGIVDPICAHTREIQAFWDCVAHDLPSPVPPDQNIEVIRILSAIYESADCGCEVKL